MYRKKALILLLVLYATLGVAGCIVYFVLPDRQPAFSAAAEGNATLSGPTGDSSGTKSVEADLPSLPELPSVSPESTATPTPALPEATPEPEYTYTASHSSQRLFIRAAASMDAEIIGSLQPGESGDVILIGEDWVLLRHGETEGYVASRYLTLEIK